MTSPPAPFVIGIDGPSGSGKSSVSRAVAARLGAGYLDTGAMYRALTWWCRHTEVDLGDADAIVAAALGLPLEIGDDPQAPTVAVDGIDVAAAIRTSEISSLVSTVATVPEVRVEMQLRQRALIDDFAVRHGACVAEGRDVTTVIAPDAQVRILLTASEEARLRRRSLEVHGATDEAAIAATRDQVVRRDRDDSTVSQFTEAAEGVTVVDTSDLDFEASVAAVMDVVAAARAS
ncbi:cytidylate kinase [Janibacter indicus]|uniref:Cytidylate kinase n=1 Tax=Janibacter indicus TaxID=857417 RepID=A0A1L3MGF9_9MICO|nr:(d)CMP kinase [Janibacter indicus]APH01382.1 cytidylate kinase [Janibacter indicus]